jgi:2'-5' RNA ligase
VQAIVSVIDDPYREQIENIWGELKAVFGLPRLTGATRPHMTFQTADSYPEAAATARLRAIAGESGRFEIETHGLGVFRGDDVSIYLHVTPSTALRALQERVWLATSVDGTSVRDVFAPATWVPHITIASGSVSQDELETAMRFLGRRSYEWRIPITNLAFVADERAGSEWARFDFGRRLEP